MTTLIYSWPMPASHSLSSASDISVRSVAPCSPRFSSESGSFFAAYTASRKSIVEKQSVSLALFLGQKSCPFFLKISTEIIVKKNATTCFFQLLTVAFVAFFRGTCNPKLAHNLKLPTNRHQTIIKSTS